MAEICLLDTHVWIWWMQRHLRLPRVKWQFLDELPSAERPYLSVIQTLSYAT